MQGNQQIDFATNLVQLATFEYNFNNNLKAFHVISADNLFAGKI